jgi:hypothetical protein
MIGYLNVFILVQKSHIGNDVVFSLFPFRGDVIPALGGEPGTPPELAEGEYGQAPDPVLPGKAIRGTPNH